MIEQNKIEYWKNCLFNLANEYKIQYKTSFIKKGPHEDLNFEFYVSPINYQNVGFRIYFNASSSYETVISGFINSLNEDKIVFKCIGQDEYEVHKSSWVDYIKSYSSGIDELINMVMPLLKEIEKNEPKQ